MKNVILTEERTGKKIFCQFYKGNDAMYAKIFLPKRGGKDGKFFVPENGYSLNWGTLSTHPFIRIADQYNTSDGRKNVIVFKLHPVLWIGRNFNENFKFAEEFILQGCISLLNFYWYEK